MKTLYGVAVAMVTPFTADDTVDVKALQDLTEMLIAKGVNCLYPCGTTGEMLRLSVQERELIIETVLKQAAGRVIVYAHVGAATQKDTIKLAKHAQTIGCDGIGVVSPQFFHANDREMEEFYVAVAQSVTEDFPVYMYNIPQCAGNDITATVAERIAARCKNIVGMKYSVADIKRTMQYRFINNGKMRVMHGTDRILGALYVLGCDGTISGNATVFPEPLIELYKACVANDRDEILRWSKVASDISDALKGGGSIGHYKAALDLRGLTGGHMRRPSLDITQAEKAELQQQLESICASSGISMKA